MDVLLQRLDKAKATSDDLPIWEAIRNDLLPVGDQAGDTEIEEGFLNNDLDFQDEENPFPEKSASFIWPIQNEMDKFVHCVFDRRFGWSEADQNGNLLKGKDLFKRVNSHSNALKKNMINERMDEFLKW